MALPNTSTIHVFMSTFFLKPYISWCNREQPSIAKLFWTATCTLLSLINVQSRQIQPICYGVFCTSFTKRSVISCGFTSNVTHFVCSITSTTSIVVCWRQKISIEPSDVRLQMKYGIIRKLEIGNKPKTTQGIRALVVWNWHMELASTSPD